MAQYIKNANIFGRIGENLGKGLAEQLPKDVERGRLSAGLKHLGEQKGQTPFQQFAGLAGLAPDRPQIIQSGTELLRQQAIIDSVNANKPKGPSPRSENPSVEPGLQPRTATTTESTESALNPYIPPSGPEQEEMARRLLASDPQAYRDIESARQAISNQVAGNTNQSNALLQKRELEESVQNRAEQKLKDEIKTLGADIPGRVLSNIQQKAVDAVTSKKMSPDKAKVEYGKEAEKVSRDFSNIRSWGGLGLVTKNPDDLIGSIRSLQLNAKKDGYQKEAADSMIAENGLTPQFAYASMYPVSDIKPLNEEIKGLPSIHIKAEKSSAGPGLAGLKVAAGPNPKAKELTLQSAPRLARAMGLEGSPLSIGYELEKKGYDSNAWKDYLLDNAKNLNLSDHQRDELGKPRPSYFGWLNDWWLKAFSGAR